jgi:D-amino-acid dehydrogenase
VRRRNREEEQLQYDRGSPAGILHLYRSDDQFEEAKREVEMLQRTFGGKVKPCAVWDADQCRAREPALRDSRASIAGGIWWEDNESGDCNMFTARLADTCRSKYGVMFLFDTGVSLLVRDPANPHRVRALLTDEGREVEVDRVVVCLGSYTPLLLRRSLDVWLPIFPVKGYSLTLRPDDDAPLTPDGPDAAPSLNIADIESKTYIARFEGSLGGRLRVVGMGELCGYDQSVDPAKEGVTNLTAVVGQLFPRLHSSASREASLWACLRPMTPYTPHSPDHAFVCAVCAVCVCASAVSVRTLLGAVTIGTRYRSSGRWGAWRMSTSTRATGAWAGRWPAGRASSRLHSLRAPPPSSIPHPTPKHAFFRVSIK